MKKRHEINDKKVKQGKMKLIEGNHVFNKDE